MKIYVTHSTKYDFKEKLYKPLKQSKIADRHEIIFPHDKSLGLYNSKDLFKNGCDCVIAEVSEKSFGIGIELGWANSNDIQIICIYKKGTKISSSLKAISVVFIEYETEKGMIKKLEKLLL